MAKGKGQKAKVEKPLAATRVGPEVNLELEVLFAG
jgi:hypothetical protein